VLIDRRTRGGTIFEQSAALLHELPAAAERVVQELVDEHRHASSQIIPIDERAWAIRGSIAYEGEVILAEFDTRKEAELALEELAASDPDVTVR
jgi:hypothetical protein